MPLIVTFALPSFTVAVATLGKVLGGHDRFGAAFIHSARDGLPGQRAEPASVELVDVRAVRDHAGERREKHLIRAASDALAAIEAVSARSPAARSLP